MGKSIFICNDGTGQGLDSKALSNVEKIFRVIPGATTPNELRCDQYKVDNTLGYHALYFRGIGVADARKKIHLEPSGSHLKDFLVENMNKVGASLQSLLEEVSGADIKDRVEGMLSDLKTLWQPGDKVYFIGFSRGASGVRIAASLAKKLIPEITIEYLLVFDTVYSVMAQVKILDFEPILFFDDRNIGTHISRCDHFIAADETREMFPLTPVELRDGVRQIMFSGSHSDVGGGADNSSLSDISLSFALDQLEILGVKIPDANIEALKLNPNCKSPVGWDLFNGTGQRHFPRDFSKIKFTVHSSIALRCASGVAPPIALAQLALFKFGSGELIELKDVSCSFGDVTSNRTSPAKVIEGNLEISQ